MYSGVVPLCVLSPCVVSSLCRLTASPRYLREDVRLDRPGRLCYLVYILSKLNAAGSLDASAANSCGGGSQ